MRPALGLSLASWLLLTWGVTLSAQGDDLPQTLVLATWNVEWFFDNYQGDNVADLAKEQSAPTRADWDWKLAAVAKSISEMRPTVLCLQEIENRRVLFYLTQHLKKEYGLIYRVAFVEGEDFFTEQDVAILALSGLVGYGRRERSSEEVKNKDFYPLQKHLFADFAWGEGADRLELSILNLHTRATKGKAEQLRIRQGSLARHWLAPAVGQGKNLAIIGDLNSDQHFAETTPLGDMGVIRGLNTETPADNFFDTLAKLSGEAKASHLNGQQYDRILLGPTLANDQGESPTGKGTHLALKTVRIRSDLVIRGKEQDKDHMNIFWTIPAEERDVSDHYPLVAEFEVVRGSHK